MSLHVRLVGEGRPNLMFLHGLFGQGRNWKGIGDGLLPHATSLLVDLPNHGHSPRDPSFGYVEMADAVAHDLTERMGSAAGVTVVGHSMGGKVAMVLALRHPELVKGLVVVDIAPSGSSHGETFHSLVAALRSIDLTAIASREDASAQIASQVPDEAVRDFLLQNLRRKKHHWTWLMNLPVLASALDSIYDWPGEVRGSYAGPVLWLRGERSSYVRPEHLEPMRQLFPRVQLVTVPGAGHWVHSDAPDAVIGSIAGFLDAEGLARPV